MRLRARSTPDPESVVAVTSRRSRRHRTRHRLGFTELDGRRLLADLGGDLALINDFSSVGTGAYPLRWAYLVPDHSNDWLELQPTSLGSYDNPSTTTSYSLPGGVVETVTTSSSVVATSQGAQYREPWFVDYTYEDDSTTTIGVPGSPSTETITSQYNLSWDASGGASGSPTSYTVTEDSSQVNDTSTNDGSFNSDHTTSVDSHLQVDAQRASDGTFSGNIHCSGDDSENYSLNDKSSDPDGSGDTVTYTATNTETFTAQGDIAPGGTGTASDKVQSWGPAMSSAGMVPATSMGRLSTAVTRSGRRSTDRNPAPATPGAIPVTGKTILRSP